ncbi:MAG: alpha/beta fold hydrolase [Desertimonas sp.]
MPTTSNGDIELYYETFGDPTDPPILLINGLGSQCINYDVEWLRMFVERGLFMMRFDNRDVGRSTWLDGVRADWDDPAYTAVDMAGDAVAVLDAVGIERATIHGVSMGGMIAQRVAIHHPERVLRLISVMSASGKPEYGAPTPEAQAQIMQPPATDREGYVQEWIAGMRVWGSPAWADEARWRFEAERAYDRAYNPAGPPRQIAAARGSRPSAPDLPDLKVPTLVMHGLADTLITPSAAHRLAELIPGARLELIEGMGHDYPPGLWPRWTDIVVDFIDTTA